ncbi:MAG: type II secretion system protein [Planctomycetota bacterium]
MKRTSPHAFTLIELLVVISIIALLIGILLPALGAARNTARISASASNQRQIGIAMAAYQADNKEFFPLWQRSSVNNDESSIDFMIGGTPAWYWNTKLAVEGYVPGLDVYADPTFEGDTSFLTDGVDRNNMGDRVYNWIHYGYNYVWVGSNLAGALSRPPAKRNPNAPNSTARILDMEDPTSVMITSGLRDFNPAGKETDASTPPIDPNGTYGGHVFIDFALSVGNAGIPHARYADRIQSSWGDGHVSLIQPTFTQEQQNATAPNGFTAPPASNTAVFGRNNLGSTQDWGGIFDNGNYFDLRREHPDNR